MLAAVAFLVGTFLVDGLRGSSPANRGRTDAQADIVDGKFQFSVGGKALPWFEVAAAAFHDRCNADLVSSNGCRPMSAEWCYDSGDNAAMEEAIAVKYIGFRFQDVFNEAVQSARMREFSKLLDRSSR